MEMLDTRDPTPTNGRRHVEGPQGKERLGDRRTQPRFDVLGSLPGQVEVWRTFDLYNLGSGGALVEGPLPLTPGTPVSGRLSVGTEQCRLRAHVIHAATAVPGRCRLGLQLLDESGPIADLIGALHSRSDDATIVVGLEERDRRRSVRILSPGASEVELSISVMTTVIDLSAAGVLLSSRVPLEPGVSAQLTMRLGNEDFSGGIEVRRMAATGSGDCHVGAAFLALDESSRRSLESLLAPKP
jgi:hypothetical protein